METVSVDIKSDPKASRVEVLVRLLYWIPLMIVMVIMAVVSVILFYINILTCLILGKRIGGSFIGKYVSYSAKYMAYMMFATDERPPIMPE
ncbi:DUF4389 domain-containing protein [Candidatus Micrarchaeota archaeon]|nr:DUF4389 domain-containing protein [Candidatus Micrarchaeota archaeon]